MTLERWQVWVHNSTILYAGPAIAGCAFLSGYALGDQPVSPSTTELPGVEPERRKATFGGCVLQWMEAPGSVQAEYELGGDNGFGSTAWSNVTVEWSRGDRGQTAIFAVEAT